MTNPIERKVKLPRKLSALLTLALDDLAKVERSKRYVVDMTAWHTLELFGNRCEVCFAGAVMAKSLGADSSALVGPGSFPGNSRQLRAINQLRQGDVAEAAFVLFGRASEKQRSLRRNVTEYDESPVRFRREMRALARDLKAAGL